MYAQRLSLSQISIPKTTGHRELILLGYSGGPVLLTTEKFVNVNANVVEHHKSKRKCNCNSSLELTDIHMVEAVSTVQIRNPC